MSVSIERFGPSTLVSHIRCTSLLVIRCERREGREGGGGGGGGGRERGGTRMVLVEHLELQIFGLLLRKPGLHVSTLFYDISNIVIKQMWDSFSRTSDKVIRYFLDFVIRHFE